MTAKEALDMVYVVTERRTTKWGMEYDHSFLLGWALNPESRIPFSLPKPPDDIRDVINWNLPAEDQKWNAPKRPDEWSDEAVQDRIDIDGERWWENAENLSRAMIAHVEREIHRETYGVWIMINGNLRYLTGLHYSFLVNSELKDGRLPDYRDRDRRWWYAWQACEESISCTGMVYLKHRQDGATSRGCHISLTKATTMSKAHVIIRDSLSKEHGLKTIWAPNLMPMWKSWPVYKKPETKGAEVTEGGEIKFDFTPRKGKAKKLQRKGLGSSISIIGSTRRVSEGDGMTPVFIYVDEPGKSQTTDLMSTWNTEKPALKYTKGKSLWTSTVEEGSAESPLSLQFAAFYEKSDRALIHTNPNGETFTSLWAYFVSCYDGLDSDWIDEYGESMIDKPTERQVEFQRKRFYAYWIERLLGDEEKVDNLWKEFKKRYENGGSYQYVLDMYASCATDRDRAEIKRKFPMTPDDALKPSATSSYFNQEILLACISELGKQVDGKPYWQSLVRIGCFEWAESGVLTGGIRAGSTIPKHKGDVKWVDYPEGHPRARFYVSQFPSGCYKPNEVVRGGARHNGEFFGIISPRNGDVFRIGLDILEWDKTDLSERDSKLSSVGAHCKWFEDPNTDKEIKAETEDELYGKQKSNSYMFEYYARPDNAEEIYEDMLKAAIYYGAKINVEKQRAKAFQNYFTTHGCLPLLLHEQVMTPNDPNPKKVYFGTNANHDVGLPLISTYISRHIKHVKKFPFIRTLKQLLTARVDNITKRDLVASMEMTEMAESFTRNVVARQVKNGEIAPVTQGNDGAHNRRLVLPLRTMRR